MSAVKVTQVRSANGCKAKSPLPLFCRSPVPVKLQLVPLSML